MFDFLRVLVLFVVFRVCFGWRFFSFVGAMLVVWWSCSCFVVVSVFFFLCVSGFLCPCLCVGCVCNCFVLFCFQLPVVVLLVCCSLFGFRVLFLLNALLFLCFNVLGCSWFISVGV